MLLLSFHPTLVLAQHIGGNRNIGAITFPSHIGSRSTYWLYRYRVHLLSFHPTLVLAQQRPIPPWSWRSDSFPSHIGSRSTTEHSTDFYAAELFPSHIGSRSTRGSRGFGSSGIWSFHPTLVLAQRRKQSRKSCSRSRFHPTLVLAQQEIDRDIEKTLTQVSIPHWFSLNRKLAGRHGRRHVCFHPTLVLAQQESKL